MVAGLVVAIPTTASAASAPSPPKPLPGVSLAAILDQAIFVQGDPIPIRLRFLCESDDKLAVGITTPRLCGRPDEIEVIVRNEAGGRRPDPFAGEALSFTCAPQPILRKLARNHPCEITVFANDWFRADKPGRYSLIVNAAAVGREVAGPSRRGFNPRSTITSGSVTFALAPCPESRRREQMETARRALQSPDNAVRGAALDHLRYLADDRTIPLLIGGLEDLDFQNRQKAQAALVALPDLEPVKAALLAKLEREGPTLLPAAKMAYTALLSSADEKVSVPGRPRVIGGYTEEWSDFVGQKMTRNLEALSDEEAVRRLFLISTYGGEWNSFSLTAKRAVIQGARRIAGSTNLPLHQPSTGEGPPSAPDLPWFAGFIAARCIAPELVPDLQQLATTAEAPPRIRVAAYQALGRMQNEPPAPVVNPDPSTRERFLIMKPDAPQFERAANGSALRFQSFRGIDSTLGKNMIPGVELTNTVRRGETMVQSSTRHLVGFETGPDKNFWNEDFPSNTSAPLPGDRIESRITIFETDLPPWRNWNPSASSRFRALWTGSFTTVVP